MTFSGTGEQYPDLCWHSNMNSLVNILEIARDMKIKVFWASSIAALGPTTKRLNNSKEQSVYLDPCSMYGITKVSGELLCQYFHDKFQVDVRSIRYPGVLTIQSVPHGGTSDFALEMIITAVKNPPKYQCYISEKTRLPWIYIQDAIQGTIQLMEAPYEKIRIRTSYNLHGISFTPGELASAIQKFVPDFEISYDNNGYDDPRQKIADSVPDILDDSNARMDWGWNPRFDLHHMILTMFSLLAPNKFNSRE